MQRWWVAGAVVLTLALAASRVDAAEIGVRAPDGCVDVGQLVEQVGVVLGRPLASVPEVDFVVEIAPDPRQGWRLRLEMTEKRVGDATGTRSRELTARTCAELADAAAVAIAMSVRSLKEEGGVESARPPARDPSRPSQRLPAVESPRPTLEAVAVRAAPEPPRRRPGLGVTFGALADTGALPGAGIGVELGGALRFSYFRLGVRGALFASQEKHLADGSGGEFALAFAALFGCLQRELGRPTYFGCAGFELGRISGEGVGVSRPRLGSAIWEAMTAEIGVAFPLSGPLAAVLRGGAAVPLKRPEFVIDPTIRVHRPASLDGRAALGLEYFF